jgi:hypothetical protein
MSDRMIEGEDDYLQKPVYLNEIELMPHSPATNGQALYIDDIPLGQSYPGD